MAHSNDKISNSIEEFEGSSTDKYEESGSEEFEFEGNGSEELEEEIIKLNNLILTGWFENHHFVAQRWRNRFGNWSHGPRDRAPGLLFVQEIVEFGGEPFEFGTSGNIIMDDFIRKKQLKWIPYDKFKNVEYLDKGGFSIVYKAIWLNNDREKEVILKIYNDLNVNLNEFLNEWQCHESCLGSFDIIYFYGFTKNPDTLKYMAVMDYANKGNLRGNLTRIIKSDWNQKLCILYRIISGLKDIHYQNLIHCDFHDGNILNHNESEIYISDLGLCQPIKSFLKKYDIYGVIPFMAPEVLRGKPYTPASDIYSFSMIMWEFTSGIPPFNNRVHDLQLSLSICKGERPVIIENTPQCYVDLMKKCWDEDPLKRPSSNEVFYVIEKWTTLPYDKKIEEINKELKCNVMEFINAPIEHNNLATESHPQACYTSRLLDFTSKELNEILESEDSQVSVKVNEILESGDLNDCIINDMNN